MDKQVRIVGVPEHFNFPIMQWVKQDASCSFDVVPEGTGKMLELLQNGNCDVAITLTEGSFKAMTNNPELVCLGVYVSSSLQWGVHVPYSSEFQNISELKGKRVAISRFNSGSHLMTRVFAANNAWDESDFEYVTVNTLAGAVESFGNQESDVFLWEKFTTQPWVDKRNFRRLGVVPTPWPCFVIMTTKKVLAASQDHVLAFVEGVRAEAARVKLDAESPKAIAQAFKLDLSEVEAWYSAVDWFGEFDFSSVQNDLAKFDICPRDFDFSGQIL
jgi:sulfonate transport system substrate-binding protein